MVNHQIRRPVAIVIPRDRDALGPVPAELDLGCSSLFLDEEGVGGGVVEGPFHDPVAVVVAGDGDAVFLAPAELAHVVSGVTFDEPLVGGDVVDGNLGDSVSVIVPDQGIAVRPAPAVLAQVAEVIREELVGGVMEAATSVEPFPSKSATGPIAPCVTTRATSSTKKLVLIVASEIA